MSILIADSGSTKTQWCLLDGKDKRKFKTQGLSPYFFTAPEMSAVLKKELLPKLNGKIPASVFFYGTGCASTENKSLVKSALKDALGKIPITVEHDLIAGARALCGKEKGIACILGTGSNSCYSDGKRIVTNNPGLGFILGDEGSGAYLGKKLIQHYLYNTFDSDLLDRFNATYNYGAAEILDAVYRKPLPNRFLASFTMFLAENRGHFMIENILEDAFNEFFYNHLYKYSETWKYPVHFVGSVAYVFRDILKEMCTSREIKIGRIMKDPMEGLIHFHQHK
jgi:hypothetical protein